MSDSTEVKLHFLDYWRVIKARAGIIILTFLLTMITAGVTVYFLPREYYSKATIEVKPDNNSMELFGQGAYNATSDPRLALVSGPQRAVAAAARSATVKSVTTH